MNLSIKKESFLKYLIIITIVSVTLSFIIKYLAINNLIPWNIGYNDVGGWFTKAAQPGIPYIDKLVEYPVIIGLIMYIAAIAKNLTFYMFFHYFLFLGAAIITTIYLYKLSNKLNTQKKYLFIFWALAPSLLWFVYFNWDIITVMFTVLALYYYKEKKDILATVFLSLGFATKMYPLLVLFPVLMHRRFVKWIKIGITFALTWLAVNIFFMLANFDGWYFFYSFNSAREPNIDSIWAIIQGFAEISTQAISIITLLLFASLYIYLNIKFRKNDFIFMSFISILLFLIINKVFSPQFTLWLLPFFALYGARWIPFYTLELSNLLVLFTTLPYLFTDAAMFLLFSGIFVIIRHIALIYIFMKELRMNKT